MNNQCLLWLRDLRDRMPERFRGRDILEVGARDVNGSARQLFEGCRYVGLDCQAGEGVDIVAMAGTYLAHAIERYDVVLCLNTLEHDPDWQVTVATMGSALRDGGLMLLSFAGPGYQEHGTRNAPRPDGFYGPDPDYYRNVAPAEVVRLLHAHDLWFERREIQTVKRICYFAGVGKTSVDVEEPIFLGRQSA